MAAEAKAFIPVQEPIGDIEPTQEAAPKRRRGRPPKAEGESAPRRRRGATLETRVGAFLTRVNIPLHIAAAILPGTIHPDDPLSPAETVALAKAITIQAQAHPTFRKYLELAISTSDSADILFVIAAIGVRRAANHGIVPEHVGQIASAALADPAALAAMFGTPTDEQPQSTTDEIQGTIDDRKFPYEPEAIS